MLLVVSISTVCSGLPIFDLFGLCEPLHAHVQVSILQPISSPFVDVSPTYLVPSLLDREITS